MPYKPLANLLIAAFLLLLSMVAVTQGSVPIAAGQLWQSLKLLASFRCRVRPRRHGSWPAMQTKPIWRSVCEPCRSGWPIGAIR